MKTGEYRIYVAGLRSHITPKGLARAKAQIARRRRKKTAGRIGKGLAAAAGVLVAVVGASALARAGRKSAAPIGPIARR